VSAGDLLYRSTDGKTLIQQTEPPGGLLPQIGRRCLGSFPPRMQIQRRQHKHCGHLWPRDRTTAQAGGEGSENPSSENNSRRWSCRNLKTPPCNRRWPTAWEALTPQTYALAYEELSQVSTIFGRCLGQFAKFSQRSPRQCRRLTILDDPKAEIEENAEHRADRRDDDVRDEEVAIGFPMRQLRDSDRGDIPTAVGHGIEPGC